MPLARDMEHVTRNKEQGNAIIGLNGLPCEIYNNYELRITNYEIKKSAESHCHSERSEESRKSTAEKN